MADTIYKYFRFDDNFINSIRQSYLWFSKCDDFNDPFEFKLHVSSNLSDQQILEYYELMKKLDGGRIESLVNGNFDAFIWSYRNFSDKFVEYFLLPFNRRVRDYGICCFSNKLTNILMWSHYSDSHKGLVLEFYKDKLDNSIIECNPKLRMTVIDNVRYSNDFPLIEISGNLDSTSDSIKDVVFTKSLDWKYESEVRIISDLTKNNYFDLSCIKSIYLGCRFEKDTDFKDLINENAILSKIPIYRMKEKVRKYELEYKKN